MAVASSGSPKARPAASPPQKVPPAPVALSTTIAGGATVVMLSGRPTIAPFEPPFTATAGTPSAARPARTLVDSP
jgi:hypothetical protein